MRNRKRTALLLAALLLMMTAWIGPARADKAPKIKKILETWLCAGEDAPVRESPKEDAPVLWTLAADGLVRTDRHVDQYYVMENEKGETGYVSKGAVRILNAKELTAGTMFKLPHVAAKTPRLPVKLLLAPAATAGDGIALFLPEEGREDTLEPGERVYVLTAYGAWAGVWHRGRLGYIRRDNLVLLKDGAEAAAEAREETGNEAGNAADGTGAGSGENADNVGDGSPAGADGTGEDTLFPIRTVPLSEWTAGLTVETGDIRENALLEQAFSMLEAGNAIAARYAAITGRQVGNLYSAGVPYFWGGQDGEAMLERWPEYTTRKQWQGTHDFYQKDSVYVFGLDCVGFVKTALAWAGRPLGETLNDLGSRKHCEAGDHLFCSEKNPFPEDWRETAEKLEPGDLVVLHRPGMHVMMMIGTLRSYGYTEEQLPALAEYLDHPLMIHCGENPFAYQRFDCLTARSEDPKVSKALGSDGGVSLCILGVPRERAETEVTCHEKSYGCFDVEGACVTVFSFGNVRDYYVYRPE